MSRLFALLRNASAAASLAATLSGCALATAVIMGGDAVTTKSLRSPDELVISTDEQSLSEGALTAPVVVTAKDSSGSGLVLGEYRSIAGSLIVSCTEAHVLAYQGTTPGGVRVDLAKELRVGRVVLNLKEMQQRQLSAQYCPKLEALRRAQAVE